MKRAGITNLGPAFEQLPLVADGHVVWFLPMEEGAGVLRIRDLHSGIARTATTEGRSQAWATDGKHVAYFASKGWGPVSLHVLEVSTGYAEMIRESIVGCIRPVLSGDLVIWRHADPPTFSDASGTPRFVKTWTGHARQGILDSGGMIELRLDARDGSVTRFQYHKGHAASSGPFPDPEA